MKSHRETPAALRVRHCVRTCRPMVRSSTAELAQPIRSTVCMGPARTGAKRSTAARRAGVLFPLFALLVFEGRDSLPHELLGAVRPVHPERAEFLVIEPIVVNEKCFDVAQCRP